MDQDGEQGAVFPVVEGDLEVAVSPVVAADLAAAAPLEAGKWHCWTNNK